jgi:uncharacterized protein
MLRVNLSALADGPITTDVAVPADAPIFEELSGTLEEPLQVKGRLSETGADQYFWQGTLETRVTERCRRCLTSVSVPVVVRVEALFTEDPDDDPSSYALPPAGEDLDLSGMVREELLLVTPAYVVCRDDCRGLCATCGRDLNSGDCSCEPEPDPRWAALEALKPQGPAKEG